MIYYDTASFLSIIFRWHGSALNGPAPVRALLMALFALLVAIGNDRYAFVVPTRDSTAFVDTLTVFNTFLGLIIGFRMNSAFQQWRSGVVAVGTLSQAARDIVSSGCAYASVTTKYPLKKEEKTEVNGIPTAKTTISSDSTPISRDVMEKCTLFTELRRLVFLYIAIVFHDCRGRDDIEKLKHSAVLTESEYDELYACGSEHPKAVHDKESYHAVVHRTPHKLRATIVELWLKRLIEVATQRGHLSPVNSNMLQLKIAQLPSLYTTVFNIANVPIPFNYMQYLQLLIIAYMTLYTFVIVPRSQYYTPLWVFMWGIFLFTADQVAMEIECPFGLDANDIDLEARLLQIEEELTVLIRSQYYFVSGGTSMPSNSSKTQDPPSSSASSSSSSSSRSSTHASDQIKHKPFSFHQGRVSEHEGIAHRESLPEINEFTALIAKPKSSSHSNAASNYGSHRSETV